jgi:glycolate oxidase FAD binding subunit
MSSTARSILSIKTVDDIVAAVQAAAAESQTLTAARCAPESACQLDLSTLNTLVDYPARDMTVTIESGMTLQVLGDLLKTEGQHLPVDVGDPDMAVGAFVASDLAGPRQYGYGTLRDYLIGMEAVDGQGRVFHAGGRVVKNVAGYDLCRLMIGSRGALGILSQLTFKLKPIPERFIIQRWKFSEPAAVAISLERLNTSATRPVVIDLETCGQSSWSLFVGVEGPSGVCEWQIERLHEEISDATESETLADDETSAIEYCRTAAARHVASSTACIIKALPSKVVDMCGMIHEAGGIAHCHAGNGVIIVSTANQKALSKQTIQQLRDHLKENSGYLMVPSAGASFPKSRSCTAGLIDAFDPSHVFV